MTATYDSFEAYNAANKGARITPRGDLFELYIPRTTIEDAELMSRARQVDPEPKVDLTVTFPGEFMASSGRMLRFEDNVAIWDDNLLEEIGDIMVAGVATASPSVSSPSVASEEPIEAAPTTVAEDLDAPPPPSPCARRRRPAPQAHPGCGWWSASSSSWREPVARGGGGRTRASAVSRP
ncbi:MAG: hypothetical protein Q605_AUC00153G0002 [Actinomyces urogenitalis DORA_12]|uniref:Uncharacterized protein n=1 Tax=Actinomyces urogenitalis DORA_12 TaxID=1403939 RepID=W1VQF0_9ACTO|nr:hypothetical protein [Actinomyces urogenitalis]ETJ07040.1 MAG: hypothetical protein Q605_AUC00153G0002 [Actinomyces urogenitalis DORA_12]MDK8835994.1 hypothetical protein [Actinomyces urogenitalis]